MDSPDDCAKAQSEHLTSTEFPKVIVSGAENRGRKRRNVSAIDYKALEAGPKIPRSKEFMFFGPSKAKTASEVDKGTGATDNKTKAGSRNNKNNRSATTTTASQEKKKAKPSPKSSEDSSSSNGKCKTAAKVATAATTPGAAAPKKHTQQPPTPPVLSEATGAAPAGLQWRTQKRTNKLIGRRGARVLPCGPRGASVGVFEGKIVAWLPAEPNEMGGHDPALWRFRHDDDGDEEDLDEGEVAAAVEALRVLEACPQPRSRDENWHEFEALATAFADTLKTAAAADAASAAVSTSSTRPASALLNGGEGAAVLPTTAPADVTTAEATAALEPASNAAAGPSSMPPVEASSDSSIVEKPVHAVPPSSFFSVMAKGTQVLAWDDNHAGGVVTANAYPATVLAVRPAANPAAADASTFTSSDDANQLPSGESSTSAQRSSPDAYEVKLHFHGFNKRYDRWQPDHLVVPFDDAAAAAVRKLHPYGVNKAAPPPLPSPSPHKRVLPEGFPPLSRAAEYGPFPAKHLEHLGLAHVKAAMPSEVVDSLASLVEQFFNKATRVVNNLGLQDVMASTGFTHLKSRSTGRWDLNPPRLLAAAGMGLFNLADPSLTKQKSSAASASASASASATSGAAASAEIIASIPKVPDPLISTSGDARSNGSSSNNRRGRSDNGNYLNGDDSAGESDTRIIDKHASMHLATSLEPTIDHQNNNNSDNSDGSKDHSSKLDQHLTWLFDGESPPWMATLKEVLGPDCECIAAGCMLSLPGSIAQPLHQDGPHLSKTGKPLDREFVNDEPPLAAAAGASSNKKPSSKTAKETLGNGTASSKGSSKGNGAESKTSVAAKAGTAKTSASGKANAAGKSTPKNSSASRATTTVKKGKGAASATLSPPPPPPSSSISCGSNSGSEPTAQVKGAKGHVHLRAHAVNVFLPLVDLTPANGGTEFYPATHIWGSYDDTTDRSSPIVPLAKAGDAILFDYRIKHRGLANNGDGPRPVVYITYAKPGFKDDANFSARRYSKLPAAAYE